MIVVIQKQTRLERLGARAEGANLAALRASHEAHAASLDAVRAELDRRQLSYEVWTRGESFALRGAELVITVGGDGTVLDVSHELEDEPVLGVNSNPRTSTGFFCAGDANAFPALLDKALSGRAPPAELARLAAAVGARRTSPALNDLLFCHANPAAVSSYTLRLGRRSEAQRSSGVWVSTPAGSTAAIRSAGGLVMPLDPPTVQYIVREPYLSGAARYRHTRGIVPWGTRFEFESRIDDGALFVDGPHHCLSVNFGEIVRVEFDAPPLRVFGLRRSERAL